MTSAADSRRLLLPLSLLLAALLTACGSRVQTWEFSGDSMGTHYWVKAVKPPENLEYEDIQWKIDNTLHKTVTTMSNWENDSELSRFNRAVPNRWFPVSDMLAEVVELSNSISRRSGGAFDITIAPLVRLWQFNTERKPQDQFTPPEPGAIRALLGKVGYQRLMVRRHPPALNKSANLELDLSAVAKGYGVDEIARMLEQSGISNYLIEVGGELRCRGVNEHGDFWQVAVVTPDSPGNEVHTILNINRPTGIATSGDYHNYFEFDGKRYSHTLNPVSGRPVEHRLASVTALAPLSAEADALATAIFTLGPEQGLNFAEQHKIPVLMLLRETDTFRAIISTEMLPWLPADSAISEQRDHEP